VTWRAQGFRAWLWQRLTALVLAVGIVYFGVALLVAPPQSYEGWRQWLAAPVRSLALLLVFYALLLHGWIGIRDVVIDYIRPFSLRFSVLVLVALALLMMAAWVARTVLTI